MKDLFRTQEQRRENTIHALSPRSSTLSLDSTLSTSRPPVGPRSDADFPRYVMLPNFDLEASTAPNLMKFVDKVLQNLPRGVVGIMATDNAALRKKIAPYEKLGRVRHLDIPLETNKRIVQWVRDYHPELIYTPAGELQATFFANESLPRQLPQAYADSFGAKIYESPLKVQGGNLSYGPDGSLYITNWVLHENPDWGQKAISAELRKALHVKDIYYVDAPPDDPAAHIDGAMNWLDGNRVVVSDSRHPGRKAALDRIANLLQGQGHQVTRILEGNSPRQNPSFTKDRMAMSYANFTKVGNVIFLPSFHRAHSRLAEGAARRDVLQRDNEAAAQFRELGFKVVQVPMELSLKKGGTAHCLSKGLRRNAAVRFCPPG
jgi:agmatine/peptidylarginine deiminase